MMITERLRAELKADRIGNDFVIPRGLGADM
jgi:hypothetical protein